MKVVHTVIRISDSQKILVRKSLRTAKEPALVFIFFIFLSLGHPTPRLCEQGEQLPLLVGYADFF